MNWTRETWTARIVIAILSVFLFAVLIGTLEYNWQYEETTKGKWWASLGSDIITVPGSFDVGNNSDATIEWDEEDEVRGDHE